MDRVANVNLRFEDYKNNAYLTHNFHPYPAKFVPQIPAELIDSLSKPNDWVLDPFVGSGTTLVEAKLAGRNSVGIDVNPLSCLVSRVKTTILSEEEIAEVRRVAARAVEEVRRDCAHRAPTFDGVDKWFSHQAQVELSALLAVIRAQAASSNVREFLEAAFSAILVKSSRQESDTRYKAIDKDFRRHQTAEFFSSRVNDMVARMEQFRALATKSESAIYCEDSTLCIPGDRLFDMAVTSPPYMNSYDYYLYHKHRMNWLGMNYRRAQNSEFGSRNKHNDHGLGIEAYNEPILRNAKLVFDRLKRGAHYCVVVGDAVLRGELVKMNDNFDCIFLSVGYKKVREVIFPQRRYTKSFTPGLRTRFKNSYVLMYRKAV